MKQDRRFPQDGLETLFGAYDENLKHLESLFDVASARRATN